MTRGKLASSKPYHSKGVLAYMQEQTEKKKAQRELAEQPMKNALADLRRKKALQAELAAAKATSSINSAIVEDKVGDSSDKLSVVHDVKGSGTPSKNVSDGQKKKKRPLEESDLDDKTSPKKRPRVDGASTSKPSPTTTRPLSTKPQAINAMRKPTTISVEPKNQKKKAAMVKRARIDHADTAIPSEKNATTNPSTVGDQIFKSLGRHRKLAVKAENREMVLDEDVKGKQALREKEIKKKAAEGRARALKVFQEMQMAMKSSQEKEVAEKGAEEIPGRKRVRLDSDEKAEQ